MNISDSNYYSVHVINIEVGGDTVAINNNMDLTMTDGAELLFQEKTPK